MKKHIFSLLAAVGLCSGTFAQFLPQASPRKVQVAILFDTSNSMDGLIEQAKSRIWNIVNEISSLRFQGQIPTIEFALYDYGNSSLSAQSQFIRQQVALTTDLDLISSKLFALTTNGGEEYCGAVIQRSLQDLNWSSHPQDLKMIYIAGNEPFNQGAVSYKEVCETASSRNVFVNTLFCGNYDEGIRQFWKDCSVMSKGDYFNINSDEKVVQIATPYDQSINQYNDSLNRTYFGYGAIGSEKKSNQLAQDSNAEMQSVSSKTERAIVKSKVAYSNESWDLIDAVDKSGKDVTKIEEAELPAEFQGKTDEQKKELLNEKKEERLKYQNKIAELAVEREKYIETEKKKNSEVIKDDFGTTLNKSILKKAEEVGYEKDKP